jgi:hypothetical protein
MPETPKPVTVDARGRPRVQTVNDLPSLTVQSDADQADIKKILKKWKTVGIVDHLNIQEQTFGDVTGFTDYADVMRTAKLAEEEFMKMPSKAREIFGHDVAAWLDTANDPEKLASLIAEGKIKSEQQSIAELAQDSAGGDGTQGDADPVS